MKTYLQMLYFFFVLLLYTMAVVALDVLRYSDNFSPIYLMEYSEFWGRLF